jgi:squalene-hopene/tetraprenyl-beta-curcumene cyclase
MPELVSKAERDAAIVMLLRKQRPDGGWSTPRMSGLLRWRMEVHPATERQPWKEAMGPTVVALIRNLPDAANPGSDPYMTAFAIVLLRECGVPASDARIRRGVAWLRETQRVSGRWWMHSLYRGNYNYITDTSTAHAVRALALCDELPEIARP